MTKEQLWIEEQMQGWMGKLMKRATPEWAQLVNDFRGGRRDLDAEVSKMIETMKFLASRVPKTTDDGRLICPHCQLELDLSAEDIVKDLPAPVRAKIAEDGNLVFKCPACKQSLDIGWLL